MKKQGLIVLIFGLILSLTVSAQDQMPPQKMEKGRKMEMKNGEHRQVTAQMRAERMAKELKLSDTEKAKVQALFEKQEASMKKHQEEIKKAREEMKASFDAERKMQESDLEKIIGAEKFKQLQAMRIERLQREVMKMKMGGFNKMHKNRPTRPQEEK